MPGQRKWPPTFFKRENSRVAICFFCRQQVVKGDGTLNHHMERSPVAAPDGTNEVCLGSDFPVLPMAILSPDGVRIPPLYPRY